MATLQGLKMMSMPSSPEVVPSRLTMAEQGTLRSVEPRGMPRMARRCCSNWEVWQASMV
jgi:hypothetical protein